LNRHSNASASAASSLKKAGLGAAAIYGAFVVAGIFFGFKKDDSAAYQLFIWPALAVLVALYWKGYAALSEAGDDAVRYIACFATAFALIGFLIPPIDSTDLYSYVNRGWEQARYGLNPYVHPLLDVPGWRHDPMLTYHWVTNVCPYGFLFAILADGLCRLGGGNLPATLALFKTVNAGAYALTGWTVYRTAARLNLKPVVALYLFLWNPLVILQYLSGGHNDLLAAMLATLAAYAASASAFVLVIPALAAASMIKYPCAVMIPFALVWVAKRAGLGTAALGLAASATIVVVVSLPYLSEARSIPVSEIAFNATVSHNSLAAALYYLYVAVPGHEPGARIADLAIKISIWGAVLSMLVTQFFQFAMRPARQPRELIAISTLGLFEVICVASSKFRPWYVGMFLPTAIVLGIDHWLCQLAVAVSLGELFAFTFIGQMHILNYFAMIAAPSLLVIHRHWPEVCDSLLGRSSGAETGVAASTPTSVSSSGSKP
jgi:alpha-1,6-mannosyltransferase